MQNKIKIFLTLFLYISLTSAHQQVRRVNHTYHKDLPIVQNFDIIKYTTGKWFEYMRTDNPYQPNGECGYTDLVSVHSDTSITIKYCFYNDDNEICFPMKISLREPNAQPLNGKQEIFYPQVNITFNSDVIEFDNDAFVISHACQDLGDGTSFEYVCILTRVRYPKNEVIQRIRAFIDKYFDYNDFKPLYGKACPKPKTSLKRCFPIKWNPLEEKLSPIRNFNLYE